VGVGDANFAGRKDLADELAHDDHQTAGAVVRDLPARSARVPAETLHDSRRAALGAQLELRQVVDQPVVTHQVLERITERGAGAHLVVHDVDRPGRDVELGVETEAGVAAAARQLVPEHLLAFDGDPSFGVVEQLGLDPGFAQCGERVDPARFSSRGDARDQPRGNASPATGERPTRPSRARVLCGCRHVSSR
jgi:hypothetical protein